MIERVLLLAFPIIFFIALVDVFAAALVWGATALFIGVLLGGAAWLVSDLSSGLVHYLADTFGSGSTPLIGSRLIRPFREHHVHPTHLLEHDFVERNGNNILLCLPLIIWIPFVESLSRGQLYVAWFCLQISLWVALTNEIHALAHRGEVPSWVRFLQKTGVILSPEHHSVHHQQSTGGNYCVTSGICDRIGARLRNLARRL